MEETCESHTFEWNRMRKDGAKLENLPSFGNIFPEKVCRILMVYSRDPEDNGNYDQGVSGAQNVQNAQNEKNNTVQVTLFSKIRVKSLLIGTR